MARANSTILLAVSSVLWSCVSPGEYRDRSETPSVEAHDPVETTEADDSISVVGVLLFPLNVGPDIVANTFLFAFNPLVLSSVT